MVDEDKSLDLVAQAQLAAERLERANKANEEIMKRMQELETRRILGGKTEAGEPPKEKVVESPQDYAKRMLRGGI